MAIPQSTDIFNQTIQFIKETDQKEHLETYETAVVAAFKIVINQDNIDEGQKRETI